jgi:hypothetical protein
MGHRLQVMHGQYARAKGRNGWFVPKIIEFDLAEHEDGTPLLTLRMFSRREAAASPLELTLALNEWEAHVLTIQLRANAARREGLGRNSRVRPHAS